MNRLVLERHWNKKTCKTIGFSQKPCKTIGFSNVGVYLFFGVHEQYLDQGPDL